MIRAECPASSASSPFASPSSASLAIRSARKPTRSPGWRPRARVRPARPAPASPPSATQGPIRFPSLTANGEILWMLAIHLALTGVPGVAAALVGDAARRPRRARSARRSRWPPRGSPPSSPSGPTSPTRPSGRSGTTSSSLGSIQVGVLAAYRRQPRPRAAAPAADTAAALDPRRRSSSSTSGSSTAAPKTRSGCRALRYAGGLPSDNDIPRYFAEWFAAEGHHGTPPLYPPDWLMSDRPPLQIGYVLSQESITVADTETLHYEILCSVVQQLWIVGL